jgi:hypothetical protein
MNIFEEDIAKEEDNTIKEILEEDKAEVGKKKRKPSCLLSFLIIFTLVFICTYGFVLFRQKLLNLEAQAYIYARQTATAAADPALKVVVIKVQPEPEATALPESATLDPMLDRTATVAAQLTSVAEFQSSVTPQP